LSLKREVAALQSENEHLRTALQLEEGNYSDIRFRRNLTHPLGLFAPTPKSRSRLFVYETVIPINFITKGASLVSF
jgi:hypothetical protein